MRDPRIEEPLNDAALDREIEQLVGVDPPAGFAARVRTRVSAEARPARLGWRSQWVMTTAGVAFATVLMASIYVGLVPRGGQDGSAQGSPTREPAYVSRTEPAGAAALGSSRPAPDAGQLARSGSADRSARRPPGFGLDALTFSPVQARPLVLPDVLIAQDEQRALALLLNGRPKEPMRTDVEPDIPPLSPLLAIDIPDVEVAPLKQIAALELEGDRP